MPNPKTTRKAKDDLRQGYAASTAAGEFVHEEMHHMRRGKHGAETRRQAVAIGLSKARRAGIPVKKGGRRKPGSGASEVSRRAGRATRGRSRKATSRPQRAKRSTATKGRGIRARGRSGTAKKGRSR